MPVEPTIKEIVICFVIIIALGGWLWYKIKTNDSQYIDLDNWR